MHYVFCISWQLVSWLDIFILRNFYIASMYIELSNAKNPKNLSSGAEGTTAAAGYDRYLYTPSHSILADIIFIRCTRCRNNELRAASWWLIWDLKTKIIKRRLFFPNSIAWSVWLKTMHQKWTRERCWVEMTQPCSSRNRCNARMCYSRHLFDT